MARLRRRPLLLCGPHRLVLASRPHLMGIINLTPDSFSDGGLVPSPEAAYRRAAALAGEGADILDLGAESTRPGARPVSVREELGRLLPALKRIRRLRLPISVDTSKPEVAEAALDAGACLLNDVTGLRLPAMREVAARRRAPVVLMHMRGTPRSMQRAPRYHDVVQDVCRELLASAARAQAAGVARERIILDPGLGFGKTARHNLLLLKHLPRLLALGYPVCLGPSRKSFLAAVLGPLPPRERAWGTAAAVALAVAAGVHILRVHDIAQMRMVARVAAAVARGALPAGEGGKA